MQSRKKLLSAIALVCVVIGVIGVSWACIEAIKPKVQETELIWERTGGFIGLREKMVVEANGSIIYLSDKFGNASSVITRAEVDILLEKTDFFVGNCSYTAKPSAADYFIYKLTVQTNLGLKTIKWVDSWASNEILPQELEEIQTSFLSLVQRLRQ